MREMETDDQAKPTRKPPVRPPMEAPALLRAEEIANLLNIGLRTFWRWVAREKFPRPDLREGHVVRWRRQTVEDWLESRCSEIEEKDIPAAARNGVSA